MARDISASEPLKLWLWEFDPMDEDTWPSFIHFTSNYRANQGGRERERERERWPFDYTLSLSTLEESMHQGVMEEVTWALSSHAMQLPLVKWLMQ